MAGATRPGEKAPSPGSSSMSVLESRGVPGTYFVHVGDVFGLRTPDPLLLDVLSGQQTDGIITYASGIRFDSDDHRP